MHIGRFVATTLALATIITTACAWHLQIHNQIAFVAESLLLPQTRNLTGAILDPRWNRSIGRAAAWADTVRRVGAPYSYNWHFVGMRENLTDEGSDSAAAAARCSSDWSGVCSGGDCVVGQIWNQSAILRSCFERVRDGEYDFSRPDLVCQQALMWVVHFIGDVAQPLHTSSTEAGGNGVGVLFNGTGTNLHDVWDRLIVYAGSSRPGGFGDQEMDPYFEERILRRIEEDGFAVPRREWAEGCGFDVGRGEFCARRWAEDSHGLVCSAVYGRAVGNGTDLVRDGYAKEMFPIVELQMAKASWRLAGWLYALVESVWSEGGGDGGHKQDL